MDSEFSIAPDHPALLGHFPGNPIVPGVVLLDEVIRALESCNTGNQFRSIPVVKFFRPLAPGQRCAVEFSEGKDGLVHFVCRSQGEVIATGQIRGIVKDFGGKSA